MNKIEGQIRVPSGCAIAAVISREGHLMTGEAIIESMKPMHDRSNGLGGGFAAYGIYPEYRDFFALHMFLDDRAARKNCEAFLRETMEIVREERIPTRKTPAITQSCVPDRRRQHPLLCRRGQGHRTGGGRLLHRHGRPAGAGLSSVQKLPDRAV